MGHVMVKMVVDEEYGCSLELTLGVGPGRANNVDDVAYVQFLLNKVIQNPQYATIRKMCGAHGKKLAVDGIIGPKTKSQIKAIQLYMKRWEPRLVADGCIDQFRASDNLDKRSRYTFWLLLFAITTVFKGAISDLVDEPDFPPKLAAMGKTVQNFNAA
ncbi:hypothetical protein [Bosea sp. (in: a-proteobacteria)]|uniref:hypothetical protein n=1 Tax=Bosea sp. (in: a-proteobacteria) TaxID=1871050 RepID=UPI002DDD53C3|nr:hypothetical protein [Bosea sp. (in: a-proteobacteria)]